MRVKPLQVLWHTKLSIFSADFQPTPNRPVQTCETVEGSAPEEIKSKDWSTSSGRLATCGADGFVRLWRIHPDQQHPVEFLASLQRHVGGVNVVRWSPDGNYLASAGDDGSICIWKQSEGSAAQSSRFGMQEDDEEQKEHWILHCVLPGPRDVVIYDLAWSPDGQYLITGSDMDNSARIWNLSKRKQVQVLDKCHQHFVQGVCWDPLGEFLATQSSDRSLNVFTVNRPAVGSNEELSVELFTKSYKMTLPSPPISKISSATATPASVAAVSATLTSTPAKTPVPQAAETPVPQSTASNTPYPSDTPVPALMKRSLVIDEVKQPETGQKDVNDVEMAEADGIKQPVPADENSRLISNTPCRPFSHAQATPRTPAVKRSMKIYHDETVLTFFRRLTFTPDGALLITPTGMYRNSNNNSVDTPVNVTFIYARNRMKAGPCVFLPGYQRPSTLVRCNPVRYSLRKFKDGTQPSVFALPYRYIFAVASLDSVFIYDTQQTQPIYQMSNLHYATLNDLAWSNDGQMLIITSADGYCSVACFDRNELGESIEV